MSARFVPATERRPGRHHSGADTREDDLTLALRRYAWPLVAALCALPRLVVLLHERQTITQHYVEKSDLLARNFVSSGTFGYLPHVASAYTQPLYGFFLVPVYWIAGRSWISVGTAQIVIAVLTALVVYEIGRRLVSPAAGLIAALIATLEPYAVWHDMHMNREITDELAAAVVVLLTIIVLERRGGLLPAALLGGAFGVAILGNARLALLPLLVAGLLIWRIGPNRRTGLVLAVALAGGAIVLLPWLVRNEVNVGCFTVTTDARALWKANNVNTYRVLRSGGWIDDVPGLPGAPPSPQDAAAVYATSGRLTRVNECAQMSLYRNKALHFITGHPGQEARKAGLGLVMLWQPQVTETIGRNGKGTMLDTLRSSAQPIYIVPLYVLALLGLTRLRRRYAVLFAGIFLYQSLAAMLFVGETRYRVPWDFLLALAASAGLLAVVARLRRRTPEPAVRLPLPEATAPVSPPGDH
ncbi:MAG: glycosyltransferase family 39 protein [Gaiellaceae bacterium]